MNTSWADRQSIRVRCLELALQGGLSGMSASPSAETVLTKAKAFEAYIFGDQP